MDKQSIHLSRPPDRPGQVEPLSPKAPSLFRNYISLVGGAIVATSFVRICLMFLLEITTSVPNPYLGILTYIILPAILIFGLVVVIAGRMVERRRRHRAAPTDQAAYPSLDL